MDVWHENLKQNQDPLFQIVRKAILEISNKYTPEYVNNLRFELNIDKSQGNVIINMITFNI